MLNIDQISRNSEPMTTQSGFGIIASIFLILLISMLTVFSASLFSTDIQISLDSLRSAQALYLCEGAIQYCIKKELKADADWSDNSDKVNIPVGKGSISLYYDPNTTATETTIRIVATVDDVSRQVCQSFDRNVPWVKNKVDFPYSLFTAGALDIKSSENLAVQDPYEVNNSSCPNISCNLAYYEAMADTNIAGDWEMSEDDNETFAGIIFVNGTVSFIQCDNLTINGTLVATGDINIKGCEHLTINPTGNYPAIVCGSQIKIKKDGAVSNEDIDIQGTVYSANDVSIEYVETFSMTGILYSNAIIDIYHTNEFEIAGSIIAQSGVKFDTCGSTGPTVNWGSKVLNQPPGFSWDNAFNRGTWEEVY